MKHVGNDIVDLKDFHARGKAGDFRFVERVLTLDEQMQLINSDNPNSLIWAFWSAKETAFKAISKSYPDVSSAPRRYAVSFDSAKNNLTSGSVATPHGIVNVTITFNNDYVHCFGVGDNCEISNKIEFGICDIGDDLRKNPLEHAKTESRMVREFTKNRIASCLMISPLEIDIIRPETPNGKAPPEVYINRKKTHIDISLSHDGRFVAYAFLM